MTEPAELDIQQVAVGYCRVSTDRQGERGYGLEVQRQIIESEAQRRGWRMGRIYVDVGSGGSLRRRGELQEVLHALANGEAHVLIVAKLDRLSRSLLDFAGLMARSRQEGWSIVALDIGVDTSTANGELIAHIIMALAQWERRIIGQRTKDALDVVRERGIKLGRPSGVSPETLRLIAVLRADGRSYAKIADLLTSQEIPTAQNGARWYGSTVKAVHDRFITGGSTATSGTTHDLAVDP